MSAVFGRSPQTPQERDELLAAIFGEEKWSRYAASRARLKERWEAYLEAEAAEAAKAEQVEEAAE